MRFRALFIPFIVVALCAASMLSAEEGEVSSQAMRAAITKAIPLIEKGAAGSAEKRTCYTCHNQGLPTLAIAEAKQRGFDVDEENLKRQLDHTAAHLKRGLKGYLKGKGQGGQVITAGYALWTLEAGGRPADEVTAAVSHYLLEYQSNKSFWSHRGKRPPSSGSDFTTTYVALRGLDNFATDQQQPKVEARRKQVGEWLLKESPTETEDRVFRLRTLQYVEGGEEAARQAAAELIEAQQPDGGWAQLPDAESDAYATGTVLVALMRTGHLTADQPAAQRAVKYLLDAQQDDGSWHVVTRAKGFQTYFESGFPHGKDQFISISASSWATLALLLSLPE